MLLYDLKTFILITTYWSILALPHRVEASVCKIDLNPDTTDIADTSYVRLVKSAETPSGTTYRYVFSPPFELEKPYILFLHGFPESSYGWKNQIDYFIRHGYGIVVPDLLGYGGTDNPQELESFNLKKMVAEIGELLDCENVRQVIGVSHDFGSSLLSRIHTYQPERLLALAFLDIGYFAPGIDLTESFISSLNTATNSSFGYPIYGYWPFFGTDEAAAIIDAHLDSMYTLSYTYNTTLVKDNFAQSGALKIWLSNDERAPIGGEYLTKVTQKQWKTIMSAQGGLGGPLKWYKAMLRGINTEDEEANQRVSKLIKQPVLLVVADRDPVGVASLQLNATLPYTVDLQVKSVQSGHFVQDEVANEVNLRLDCFFKAVLNITAT